MTFKVTKQSDSNYRGHVRINTLEELKLFMEFNNCDVALHRLAGEDERYGLEILDEGV